MTAFNKVHIMSEIVVLLQNTDRLQQLVILLPNTNSLQQAVLLLPNTDRLQQCEDYVRGCS